MKRATLFALLIATSCVSVPNDTVKDLVTARGVAWEAPAGEELTADRAVAIAIANNPRLQVTLAEVGIARADLLEASTIANPLLEVEIRSSAPYRAYELRVAQSLIELLQLPRRRALGRTAFDAAQLRISAEVLRFAADVRTRYYDALAETQHTLQARVLAESARTAAELALKQHGAENITDLDLENEQARYEQAKLDLATAERRLLVAREALSRALAMPDVTLPETFPQLPQRELDEQQLTDRAAAQRLDIAIAQRELDLAQRRIPVARLAALGNIVADVHYQREPSGERTVGPGIEIPIPIFNNGRAARTRAEAQWMRAKSTLAALQAESASRLRVANATLAEARARVEYYRDVVLPRRQRIVQLTKLEHNAMLVGVFQLLDARENEARAERDYVDAQHDYWLARIDLDRAVQGVQ
jgi:cobalt-zinc-cadmium efflux system outer membrane protein